MELGFWCLKDKEKISMGRIEFLLFYHSFIIDIFWANCLYIIMIISSVKLILRDKTKFLSSIAILFKSLS